MERHLQKKYIVDLGMISFLILFPHFVPLPFYSYSIICFLAIVVFLRRSGKRLSDIGLKKNRISLKIFIIGIITSLFWVAFMRWLFVPAISSLFTIPKYTEYNFIKNNISNLIITVIAAWLVGGFYEEIVFRGFINSTFEKYLGSFWVCAFATSFLFGIYHWQQGIFGVVAATLGGLYWSLVYKYFGRNLWYPILSHAFFDTITLILIYFGLLGK